ncbi:hypothetical protein HMPREF0063_12114 [Aeromicrobium marinum DSM 15272]|uniref:Inositolphosphotransferase Aur1/Ipt1 domain-containing protein n=1 Tax=Aeromicrobium marinum DSM 15272 TaxID=585531 RepID=E2SCF2_9ACTN|nr:phosphatase PAP2 family protein [Aeromicrobium marinum]EFQ82905.1 hypothetical protein HMPREF0063_12114 [Aeromicrobium marinum DSM 15272]
MQERQTAPAASSGSRLLAAALELGLVAVVYLLYRAGRMVTLDAERTALANAVDVRNLQQALRLPSEASLQALVPSIDLLESANVYYVAVHFPVTIGFLLWGYLRRPRAEYVWARNLMVVQTAFSVVLHIVYPLAPPRMFPDWGFVDTMTVYGPSAYDGASAAVANQYAAMPSLHVGWSVLIAVVVSRTGPAILRRLAVAHAAVTITVVTVTANHWFLDGAVAVGLLGLALLVFPAPGVSRLPLVRPRFERLRQPAREEQARR